IALGRLEEAGEAPDRGEHLRPEGALGDRPDLADEALVVVQVDAGTGVGRRARLGRGGSARRHAAWIGDPADRVNRRPCYRSAVQIAVVIPALHEADRIEEAIRSARSPGV